MDSILSVNPAWYIVIPIILFIVAIIGCCCCKLRKPKRRALHPRLHRERVRRVISNVTSSNNNGQQQQQESPLSDVFVIDVHSFTMRPPPYSPAAPSVSVSPPPAYFIHNVVYDLPPPTYEQALLNDESLLERRR